MRAQAGVEMVAAVSVKGTLWAKTDTRGKPPFSLKKAFFWAVWIEIAMIAGFASIDFDKHWEEVKNAKILRAVPVELPPELGEPPEEIKKPPPPPEQKPQEKPKQDTKEAAPIEVDTPPPAPTRSVNAVSVPEAVGEVSQGAGRKSEAPAAPSPAPTVAPAAPAAPAGPRSIAAILNRQECMAALVAGYPREARRANQEGSLVALVSVEPSGQVSQVDITQANPRRVFDRALSSGLKSPACRFTPAAAGYQAIVPFEYKLSGEILE